MFVACSLAIRLLPMLISDTHLISAIQAVNPDIMRVNEFTTVLDDRQSTPTVGYFVELAGTLGLSNKVPLTMHCLTKSSHRSKRASCNSEVIRGPRGCSYRIPNVPQGHSGPFAYCTHCEVWHFFGVSSVEGREGECWTWTVEGACRPG